MYEQRLIAAFILSASISVGGCQRLSNSMQIDRLMCGSEFPGSVDSSYIQIKGPDGEALSGYDFELIGGAPDRDGRLPEPVVFSSRGCVTLPSLTEGKSYAIRSRNQSVNLSRVLVPEDFNRNEIRLESYREQGMLVECAAPLYGSDEVKLPIQALDQGVGFQLVSWTLRDAKGQVLSQSARIIQGYDRPTVRVDKGWSEGSYSLDLGWKNLLETTDQKEQTTRCDLLIDRQAPRLLVSYPRSVDQQVLRVQPSAVVSIQAQDRSPSQVFVCTEIQTGECEAPIAFRQSDTETSLRAPELGTFRLHYFAKDAAGNQSELHQDEIEIFQSDRLNQIRLGLKEASSLANSDQFIALRNTLNLWGEVQTLGVKEQSELEPTFTELMLRTSLDNKVSRRLTLEHNAVLGEKSHSLGDDLLLSSLKHELFLHSADGKKLQTITLDTVVKAPLLASRADGRGFSVIGRHPESRQSLSIYGCGDNSCELQFKQQGELTATHTRQQVWMAWSEDGEELLTNFSGEVAILTPRGKLKEVLELRPEIQVVSGRMTQDRQAIVLRTPDHILVWDRKQKKQVLSWSVDAKDLPTKPKTTLLTLMHEGEEYLLLPERNCLRVMRLKSNATESCKLWPDSAYLVDVDAESSIGPGRGLAVILSHGFAYFPLEVLLEEGDLGAARYRVESLESFVPDAFESALSREAVVDWHFDQKTENLGVLYPDRLEFYSLQSGFAQRSKRIPLAIADFSRQLIKFEGQGSWILRHNRPMQLEWIEVRSPWTLDQQKMLVQDQSSNSFVRVLDNLPQTVTQSLRSIDGPPRYLTESKNLLAVLSQTLVSYDLQSGSLDSRSYRAPGIRRPMLCGVAYDPKSQRVIVVWPHRVLLWEKDLQGFRLLREIFSLETSLETDCRAQAFSYAGQLVVATLHSGLKGPDKRDGRLQVFNFEGQEVSLEITSETTLRDFTISPDGRWLAILEAQPLQHAQSLRLINLANPKATAHTLSTPVLLQDGGMRSLMFSPDSRKLAAFIKQGRMYLVQYEDGRGAWLAPLTRTILPSPAAKGFHWMPDSKRIAILNGPKSLEILNLQLESYIKIPLNQTPTALEVHEDGNMLSLVEGDRTLLFPLNAKQVSQSLCQRYSSAFPRPANANREQLIQVCSRTIDSE